MLNAIQIVLAAILGWLAGMLVNYLADVLPRTRRFSTPFCLSCGVQQHAANYFFWPRRCASCDRARPLRTWLVEAGMSAAAVWLWVTPPPQLPFLIGLVLLVYFGVVVVIDLEHRLILHPVSLFGAILCFSVGVWRHNLGPTLIGGLAGFGAMFTLYLFGVVLVRVLSRWRGAASGDGEALGFGDVVLSGVLGLLLGWPSVTLGLFITILLGGLVSLAFIVVMMAGRRYRSNMALPYGPFLVASAVLLIFFPEWMRSIIQ